MVRPQDVEVKDAGTLTRVLYEGADGEVIAILSRSGTQRIGIRWDTFPKLANGSPAWFEVPEWMEKSVLVAVAEKLAVEVGEAKAK